MPFKIAIPSHKRPLLCKEVILHLQKNIKYDIEYYIFINEYSKEYEFDLPNVKIVITNTKGVQAKRNFIYNYFENNDKIVCFDDSFNGLLIKKNNKLIDFLDYYNLILIGFHELLKNNTILFGVNIVGNPFFMNKSIQIGNYPICSKFYGFIVDKNILKSINPYGLAEDQEVTLRVVKKYGCVLRFGIITFNKPRYGKLEGGVQSQFTNDERKIAEQKAYKYLSKQYVALCEYKTNGIGLRYKRIKK